MSQQSKALVLTSMQPSTVSAIPMSSIKKYPLNDILGIITGNQIAFIARKDMDMQQLKELLHLSELKGFEISEGTDFIYFNNKQQQK